ncbi:MAG: NUMOD4 domain-containing protein [Paracoccaceae bacterium]
MEDEVWRDVEGTNGLYEVSNFGRVKSFGRSDYKWKKPRILRERPSQKGYLRVGIGKKDAYIHRLVAKAFIDNPQSLPFVNHMDGNRKNNTLNNLEWCTPKENLEHAVKTGLMPDQTGSGNYASKLSENDVLKIRALFAAKSAGVVKLSREFKVTAATISKIVHRKVWTHI